LTNLTQWTAIVVEDTFDDVQLVSAILTHHGINIHVAHNGEECLDLLDTIKPTVIITDLAMPEMDGWHLLNAIRDNIATQHIPVVAVTAYDSVDVAHDALKSGFDAYIAKPLSPRNLVQQLEQLIG